MKKIFTLFAALAMVMSMSAAKLYLTPNANWNQSNARFAAYFFGNGEKWISMTNVTGETNLYEVEAPAGYPNVIFCRMNPSAPANNWNNKWNQTADLVIPTDGKNHYTVKTGTWDKGGGAWSIWPIPAEKNYVDVTITITATASASIKWSNAGDKLANATDYVAMTAGENNTYTYTLSQVDDITGVTYTIKVGDVISEEKTTFTNVTADFKDLMKQAILRGSMNGWGEKDKMTIADDYLTASIVLPLDKGSYSWKMFVGVDWLGGGKAVTRENNTYALGEGADCTLNADVTGDYTFTWTYATKTLVVTYPESGEIPEPEPTVISYVLMGVGIDWSTGIALTVNPDNANECVLLGQEIAEGDAVKVVTLTNGVATAYCGNVDEYSVAHDFDENGNIVLAPGKYDFYFKLNDLATADDDIIYIGAANPVEPEGIEVVLENAYKEVYLVWNRANFFGEHATYGDISVQVNNYNGYGTYAEGVSSRIDGVKVNGSATFENKGETDLLTATLSDAEGTVYVVKAEVPTPKTYEVVATNATYVNVDQGWTAELTVNGLTVGKDELTLKVYWDGVGGSEEGYEASAGFEGSLQGMIFVDKGEDDVLSFEGTLKDASDNSYIFDFEATPKAAETYTLTFEEMVIEPGQWDDNLHITAENTEYAIEFQLFGGKTKGYGEYGFTDDYPDVDEIYINFEYATMAEGTVANYYLNEETGLATIELTVVLGIDIYNITLTGQPLVNPEDILPTDTINITMTEATIGLYMGMPKVAASSEEADLSIVLVGENPYKATVEDFSASSYLVTTAGSLTFLRGGLEIVEVGDVMIAYIGVLCSDHKWYNITLTTGTELPTALENLDTTVAPAKAIVNGQLVIIKNGVQYNAQGAVVK